MEKPKIKGIFSKEYKKGRSDLFLLDSDKDIHKQLVSFLRDLGISEEKLEEFDTVTTDVEGYFFVYNNGIKIHLLISDEGAKLIVDSKIPKEKLISLMEKNFQVF